MKYQQTKEGSIIRVLCVLCTMLVAINAHAYNRLDNYYWSPPAAHFQYGTLSNVNFRNAFITAMERWNGKSAFAYSGDSKYDDPCAYKPINLVSIYGHCAKFSSNTIAITVTGTELDGKIFFTGIYFNPKVNWGVHSKSAGSSSVFDFTRVAVHELGHALGLDHETSKPAAMQPLYHNMAQAPTADDIAGLLAIYGKALPELQKFYFPTLFNILLAE